MRFLTVSLLFLASLEFWSGEIRAADRVPLVKLTSQSDRVRIEVDGNLFSEYIFVGGNHPFLYPILMIDGTSLTRDFPMKDTADEEVDHPWQRSLWFAHSSVNHIDFWNEATAGLDDPAPKGHVAQDKLLEVSSGKVGLIRARNRWLAADGTLVCTDETTLRVRGTDELRILDYEIIWRALPDKPLLIGDNKDGTIAIRLAQWMTLPHKYKKQDVPGRGHLITSTSAGDADAWGKRADWCDYSAPRNEKIYGVALFDHPLNLRHPTWWMARDYGLFGANPFGQHDFEHLKDQPHLGDYTIPAGGELSLRYRFIFHYGDEKSARVAELYRDYANENETKKGDTGK